MYIDKGFVKYTNTQWEALKLSFLKRNVGQKLWFLHQYCLLTGKEPELLEKVEKIKQENVKFVSSTRKVRIGKGFSCYGWEGTYYVTDINITDEQYKETQMWYKRVRARKDGACVNEATNENNKSL